MRFNKQLLLLSCVALFVALCHKGKAQAQNHLTGPIKWMSFEEAVEKSKTEKKKIFIDVYTGWCGWCKVMDKNTFPDPEVAKLLNENFYPVKFDAEQTADVIFHGTTFKFIEQGNRGYHQLAAALLNNQLSYPNFVFLDEEFRIIPIYQGYTSLPGYKKPEEFYPFLSFVAGNFYQKSNIQEYQKVYKSPYTLSGASVPGNN
jgi:thioredoxin-related protein